MKYDYSIYLVTDRNCMSTATLGEAVEQAILGGCTMVQLRETGMSSLALYHSAIEIKQITDKYKVPLLINNSIETALAVGAAGVHIGQNDMPAEVARRLLGQNRLLGVSVTNLREALQAQSDGADYLGVGAMFPTQTKKDAKLVPMSELRKIRENIKIPIVVIGGIHQENAAMFAKMGVDGLAVISAVIAKQDIRGAAEELKRKFCSKGER